MADVDVPVVGGHAGVTILPLFSQATPHTDLSAEEIDQLTKRTQDGGTEVVQAKAGKVSSAFLTYQSLPIMVCESCCVIYGQWLWDTNAATWHPCSCTGWQGPVA